MEKEQNIRKIKRLNPQKLFGCIGSRFKLLRPALSGIEVLVRRGKKHKRRKPKKNSGEEHALQCLAAKFCGHKSSYKMDTGLTPRVLRRRGIRFPEKSTHYDNIGNIVVDSVWAAVANLIQKILPKEVTAVLDFTSNSREGNYEAKRNGYIGKNKRGKAEIGECHQLATVTIPSLKLIPYMLRLPGEYNPFSNPAEYGDRKLSGLNFNEYVAKRVVRKVHKLYPNRIFRWLMDAGFDKREFWKFILGLGDSFLTRIDKESECTKTIERLIQLRSIILKQGGGFKYHEALLETGGMKLYGVYIKPENERIEPYWLVTNKNISGIEMKKEYDMRSAGEPLHDYFKEDFNGKKPCSKKFAGAQAHTALTSLAFNIVSMLSQEILGAYYRLGTMIAELVEFFFIETLFTPNPITTPPPKKNSLAIRPEKIVEKGNRQLYQAVLSTEFFWKNPARTRKHPKNKYLPATPL